MFGKIKKQEDFDKYISYDCGCEVEIEWLDTPNSPFGKKTAQWIVTYFCDDHDPTIEHDDED